MGEISKLKKAPKIDRDLLKMLQRYVKGGLTREAANAMLDMDT
jgi:hypothetical protein